MGEAKKRGTLEQRKAMAIKRNAKILKEQRLAGIAKRQAMTPEEKEKAKRAKMLLITLYGMAGRNGQLPRLG